MKRKSVFSIVLAVVALILCVATLVACNDDQTETVKYTITFDDGSEPAKTVTLEEGKSLTAEQLPTAKTVEGKVFVGWYIGETKVEAGYTPTEDVTATAKYASAKVTVSFMDGETVIKTVEIDYGTAIAADKLPEDLSKTDYKFTGWFDGATKFNAEMTFNEDKTFVACFVGAQDYSGLWVDEDKKTVIFFDENYLFVGTDYCDMSKLTFDADTGEMKYPKPSFGNGWTLVIEGNQLKVTKIASDGNVEYSAVKQTEASELSGTYVKNASGKMVVSYSGYALIISSYDVPEYQYVRLTKDGADIVLTCVDGNNTITAPVTVGDGYLNIGGNDVNGVWMKNSRFEFQISGGGRTIYKHTVDGEFVYALENSDGQVEIITLDKELKKNDGDILTVTLADKSEMIIKIIEDNSGYYSTYTFAIADSAIGTYVATSDEGGTPVTQTLRFDGFGKVEITSSGDGPNETCNYYFNSVDILVVKGNFGSFGAVLKGETFDKLLSDNFEGSYKNFTAGGSIIELDGFGQIAAIKNSSTVKVGTYTVNKNDNTITVTGIVSNGFADGTYDFIFDNATAHINGTYWCKEDNSEDKLNKLIGSWISGDKTLKIDSFMGTIEITIDGEKYSPVLVLKYDRSVLRFTAGTTVYTVTIGENSTVKLTWDGGESIYTAAPTVGEEFFGTWTNDNDTMKVVIDEETIKVDFNETSDELVDATLVAADSQGITITVGGLTYVLTLENGEINVTETGNSVATLQKPIITNDRFIGSWKAKDVSKELNLVITAKSVTLNGQKATNIEQTFNSVKFTVDGTNYTFEVSYSGSIKLKYDSLEIDMVDADVDEVPEDAIIKDSSFYGTWTWNNDSILPTTGRLVIDANGVTFNGEKVQNLTCDNEDSTEGIKFEYNGNSYNIYITRFSSSPKIQYNYNVADLTRV